MQAWHANMTRRKADFTSLYFSAAQISAHLSMMHNGRDAFSRSHPGHVSCLIGATPLNCLRCTIARRRLTHCDYASGYCMFIPAPAISSGPFQFSSALPFFLQFFSHFFSLYPAFWYSWKIGRLYWVSQLWSKDSRSPLFARVSCEIPRKDMQRNCQ